MLGCLTGVCYAGAISVAMAVAVALVCASLRRRRGQGVFRTMRGRGDFEMIASKIQPERPLLVLPGLAGIDRTRGGRGLPAQLGSRRGGRRGDGRRRKRRGRAKGEERRSGEGEKGKTECEGEECPRRLQPAPSGFTSVMEVCDGIVGKELGRDWSRGALLAGRCWTRRTSTPSACQFQK